MAGKAELETTQKVGLESLEDHVRPVCEHAAKLYGLGYDRSTIAKAIMEQLYGHKERDREAKLKDTRRRLRAWENKAWFRDLVWDSAVVQLDMSSGQILRGITKQAKKGRVDAAKLALGITGRYVDKANDVPAAVTINLVGVPRPDRQAVGASDQVQLGEVIDED